MEPQLFADIVIANMSRLPSRAAAGVHGDSATSSGLASIVKVDKFA
jgi:hypothetical protein